MIMNSQNPSIGGSLARRRTRVAARRRRATFESLEPRWTFDAGDTLATALDTGLGPTSGTYSLPSAYLGDGGYAELDVDLYRVDAKSGYELSVDSFTPNSGVPVDSILRLFDAAGNELTYGFNGTSSHLDYVVPASGTYYVGVSAYYNFYYDPHEAGSGYDAFETGDYGLQISLTRLPVETPDPHPAGASLRASYLFQGDLEAEQQHAPALVAIDPLGANGFETATVFGHERQVYRLDGNRYPTGETSEQAGLELDMASVIGALQGASQSGGQASAATTNYSVELVFEFSELNPDQGWRKIMDLDNRQSDAGLYVEPTEYLQVYADGGDVGTGVTQFTTNEFHHVVLVNAAPVVQVYLDGVLDFTTTETEAMNMGPDRLLHLFLDDVTTGGEYADARVALLQVYQGALSGNRVAALAADPFTGLPAGALNHAALDGLYSGTTASGNSFLEQLGQIATEELQSMKKSRR